MLKRGIALVAFLYLIPLIYTEEEEDGDAVQIEGNVEDLEPTPKDKLLYLFELSSQGSTYPITNITGLEQETGMYKRGQLTPFGAR